MIGYIKQLYNRMGTYVHAPYADIMLGILFYLEAIIFLPTDPMLVVYCIERRDRAFVYAAIATIASVLGGITGYVIGALLWDALGQQIIYNPIVNYFITPERFMYLSDLYRRHEWYALLLAGIPPIPFKAVTLTAGFCKLPLVPFIICSLIIRGVRFYSVALLIKLYGVQLKYTIDRYFAVIVFSIVIAVILVAWWLS